MVDMPFQQKHSKIAILAHISSPTRICGTLIVIFTLLVYVFGPNTLPEFNHGIIAIFYSIIFGIFGFFLTGDVSPETRNKSAQTSILKFKIAVGIACLFLSLLWWWGPLAPIENETIARHKPKRSLDALGYFTRGKSFIQLKKYDKAIYDFSQAIALNNNYVAAYRKRGIAYRNLKLYSKAIADYNLAITIDPNNSKSYYTRGNIYEDLKHYHPAITDYSSAIELDNKFTEAYNNRGHLYKLIKQYINSIADHSSAIELAPNSTNSYIKRGFSYTHINQFSNAILDFNRAIELNPKNALFYTYRCGVYHKLGQNNKAIDDCSFSINLDQDSSWAYVNRSAAYIKLKKYHQSLADINKGLVIEPDSILLQNTLAWLLATCTDNTLRDGKAAIKIAKTFDSGYINPVFLDTLAAAYAETGNFKAAISTQKRVIEQFENISTDATTIKMLKSHLAQYRRRKPWRE